MAVFDKLMFWKKDDTLAGLDKNALPNFEPHSPMGIEHSPSMPGIGHPPGFGELSEQKVESGFGGVDHDLRMEPVNLSIQPANPSTSAYSFSQTSQQYPEVHRAPMRQPAEAGDSLLAKEMEIISTKLDYLKASLESINQRLANLERIAQSEQEQQRW